MSTNWAEKTIPYDPLMEERYAGYEMAARQAREGRRIGGEGSVLGRVALMLVVFVSFAAVGLTCAWVFSR